VTHTKPVPAEVSLAAATPRGLILPEVRDADSLSLKELAVALTQLTDTAREGKTTPYMLNGTITITNVGVFGVDTGTPIINPGESAILCLGAIQRHPVGWRTARSRSARCCSFR
jgi:pyruvate dehydrogenase E2 component (dihydrolipoamide acetyltransferase)